jgi:tetratricopeptide (TPR) repeat protein
MNLALGQQKWSTAIEVIRRMQGINAKNATVTRALGVYYATLGFPDRAAVQYRLSTKLDPLSPIAWSLLQDEESTVSHYDAAIEAANAVLALIPDNPGTLGWLCVARVARGELDEARRLAAKLEQTPDGRQLKGCRIEIARVSGKHAEAVRLVDERVKNNQGDVAYMAQNYLLLGEYQKALPLLRRAYDEGDAVLYRLPLDPDTPRDFLRSAAWRQLTELPRFRAWTAAHNQLAKEIAAQH